MKNEEKYGLTPFSISSQVYNGPPGALCGYGVHFPADDLFLGGNEVVLDYSGRDGGTHVREQVAYWMAGQMGIPFNYRRFINLYVNGVQRDQIYEDTQKPDAAVLKGFYPANPKGELFKMEVWWQASSLGLLGPLQNATMERFPTTGNEHKPRYRWTWEKRADPDGSGNSYGTGFHLDEIMNSPGGDV